MIFKKILYMLLLLQLLLIQSYAKNTPLDITPIKEISILNTLDIDPSFLEDYHYVKLKSNINALKRLYFVRTLKRGNLFMPNLQDLLGKANIPNTFLYMAMVESKFLADSKSHKHAAGLWQFMPATAKKYRLTKNKHIDERLDPIKSTKAAIEYLQYLHRRFHKWYLAAMAYNCGESRLYHGLKKAGTDDLSVLLDEKENYIPKETRNYIQRILVAALLAHDKKIIKQNNSNHLFGFCTNKKLVKLFFKGGQSLQSISAQIGVPVKKLKDCNPQFIHDTLPPGKKMFYVYLPEDIAAKARMRIKNMQETFVYHVKTNDTLFLISKKFNIRMQAIKMLNPDLKKTLKIGQAITLLGHNPFALEHNQTKAKVITNQTFIYTLEKNQSLYGLSLKFNNKLEILKKLNPTLPQKLKKGMQVTVLRDVNISPAAEVNQTKIIAAFKTQAIHEDTNKSKEIHKTAILQGSVVKKQKITPPHFRSIIHTVKADETCENILSQYNLKMKDILKPGNVIIIKIKEQSSEKNKIHANENNNTHESNNTTAQHKVSVPQK